MPTEKDIQLLLNKEIYTKVIQNAVPGAKEFVWIATADIKDMYVSNSGQMKPFLSVLADLIKRKVEVRLMHAKEPGAMFRKDFDKYPALFGGLERMLCPRVHFKIVIIDGKTAYTGSANLTGAGMGAKGDGNRNFENGIYTQNQELVSQLSEQFDSVWRGDFCRKCSRKAYCGDCPIK